MGNILNQWLAQRKIMGWHKRARVFVEKPNGLHDEQYFEIQKGHLMVKNKQDYSQLQNPKIKGTGSINSSTYQKTFTWKEGEDVAWPLFEENKRPFPQDDDSLSMRIFNLGVMFARKQMENKLGGMDSIPVPFQWAVVGMMVAALVMLWQLLGAAPA